MQNARECAAWREVRRAGSRKGTLNFTDVWLFIRSKFLSSTLAAGGTTQSASPSGTSSPVPLGPAKVAAASGVSPAKAAELLAAASKEQKETAKDAQPKDKEAGDAATTEPESAEMAPSTSGPEQAASVPATAPAASTSRAPSSLGINGVAANGTWGTGAGTGGGTGAGAGAGAGALGGGERGFGTLGIGRDPRGKARSRDYLKQ